MGECVGIIVIIQINDCSVFFVLSSSLLLFTYSALRNFVSSPFSGTLQVTPRSLLRASAAEAGKGMSTHIHPEASLLDGVVSFVSSNTSTRSEIMSSRPRYLCFWAAVEYSPASNHDNLAASVWTMHSAPPRSEELLPIFHLQGRDYEYEAARANMEHFSHQLSLLSTLALIIFQRGSSPSFFFSTSPSFNSSLTFESFNCYFQGGKVPNPQSSPRSISSHSQPPFPSCSAAITVISMGASAGHDR